MKKVGLLSMFTLFAGQLMAQTSGISRGATALSSLTSEMEAYLDPVTTVVYVAAGIGAIINALRVFFAWQQGKDNVMSTAAGWFAGMLFILAANAIVRAMLIG